MICKSNFKKTGRGKKELTSYYLNVGIVFPIKDSTIHYITDEVERTTFSPALTTQP